MAGRDGRGWTERRRAMVSKRDLVNRIKSNFPQDLLSLAQWVCWRIEVRDDKPTKVPYSVNGQRAASDNPATWASFDAACKAFLNGNYNGVGFMFSEHDPYIGIDFDKCIQPDGTIDQAKLKHFFALNSYTERSQSGTGAHIIVKGLLPPGGRKSNQQQIEIYDRKRFFVVTGDCFDGYSTKAEERQAQIEQFHKLIFPAKEQAAQQHHANGNGQIPTDDQTLLDRMFSSRNGADIQALWNGDSSPYNGDESAADLALCNYLAFWTGNDAARMDRMFRQSRLYRDHKWNRPARTGEKYGEGTIARAIAGTKETYSPRRQTTGEIHAVESVAPAGYTNGNGSHNHAEQGADDGYAQPEELPKTNAVDALRYRAEDGGILDAWMDLYGEDWIFSVGHDLWYQWSGTHWALDNALRLGECIQDLMDRMNQECSRTIKEAPGKIKSITDRFANAGIDIPDKALKEIENIKTSIDVAKALHKATKRSSHRVNSVDVMAQKKRKAPTPRFNATESLNLANGTLDLRSLELLPHDRQDLFTYCLDYAYDSAATCQRWEQFLREVLVKEGTTETDQDLVSLLQELIGYSLTTQTKYQVMIWMSGEGSNGKSVAIAIIKALLGPMAVSVDFQTLGTPGNYDMADIPGARVLFSLESEKGVGISEKHIKSIVTGDPMKTRPIYGSPIDFVSTAKIWWAMNDKPVIKDTTNAIWRRMKLIPFYRTFEEGKDADPDLLEKLRAELPGILNWAIKGLTRLTVNKKFTGSETSNTAKQQYREQSNPVAQWINTMTVRTDFPATLQAALYANFKSWCIDNGERVVTSTQFGLDLKRLKIDSKHRNTGNMYHLALVDSKEK